MKIIEIKSEEEKIVISRKILESLPNWFGIPESIDEYVEESKRMPFWVALEEDKVIGFIAIKQHNIFSAELYVMGIDEKYHKQGIGRALIECCEVFCKEKGIMFLQVKTLDETHPDKFYAKTRAFYNAMGFKPIEVFSTLWDASNPCLMMMKYILKEEKLGYNKYRDNQ